MRGSQHLVFSAEALCLVRDRFNSFLEQGFSSFSKHHLPKNNEIRVEIMKALVENMTKPTNSNHKNIARPELIK